MRLITCFLALLAACAPASHPGGDGGGPGDGGSLDSGAGDAGAADAGTGDAGPFDAGGDAGAACLPPSLPLQIGSLPAWVEAVPIAASGSEGFVEPSAAELSAFEQAFVALLNGEVAAAQPAFDALGFDLSAFRDASGAGFLVVRERPPGRAGGTFVVNPRPGRALWLEAPHAGYEAGTVREGAEALVQLDAVALLVTGAHRCASSAATPCIGTTTVCGGEYKKSDSAHYPPQFFTSAHRALRSRFATALAVSLHGMTPCCGELATVSDGTSRDRPGSISRAFRDRVNARLPPDGGASFSCNDANDNGRYSALCGTTDVQGMIDNGSPDACATLAGAANDTFLHVEQAPALRQAPQPVVDALGALVFGGDAGCR